MLKCVEVRNTFTYKHIYPPPLQTTHTHISILIRIIFRERSVETRSYACFYMRRSNLAFSTHNRMSFGPSYVRSGPFGFPFSNFSTIWQWYILFLLSTCSCCQLVERIIWWNDRVTHLQYSCSVYVEGVLPGFVLHMRHVWIEFTDPVNSCRYK